VKYIISGTNRPGSRSLQVAKIVQGLYLEAGEKVEIIDLQHVGIAESNGGYGEHVPPVMKLEVEKVNSADGLIIVCPEYNGSYPGALKYFIDHWKYPDSFENRPIAFIGLGGQFGGLRPVEHLQGVFGYRNAFMYPERVFLFNVWNILKNGELLDGGLMGLLRSQVHGFQKFTEALRTVGLDANSRRKKAP
jgi:NAD(P)H-dependent FMN reductase